MIHALRLTALWFALLWMAPVQAHLMAAQKGTLNIVNDAAFLVLSVPVSALKGVDDDGDGALSKAELTTHADAIRAQVKAGVERLGPDGALPLQLMMLDIAPVENAPTAAAGRRPTALWSRPLLQPLSVWLPLTAGHAGGEGLCNSVCGLVWCLPAPSSMAWAWLVHCAN